MNAHWAKWEKVMMKFVVAVFALAAALAITPSAKADTLVLTLTDGTTAAISYTVGSGIDSSTGGYYLTDGSITLTCSTYATSGGCVSETASLSWTGDYGSDNEVYIASTSLIDGGGLLFAIDTSEINLYSSYGSYYLIESDSSNESGAYYGTVPEPSSLLLLAGGLFVFVAFAYRKHGLLNASLNM